MRTIVRASTGFLQLLVSRSVASWGGILLTSVSLAYCGGGGGGGGGSTAVAPPPNNVPRFAYVANELDASVSIYTVNAETGQLRHNGFVFAGTTPRSVSVDPSGKFAYVANAGSEDVSAYTINATTGALTPIVAITPTGSFPFSITVDPSGKFAYVANSNSDDVSAYTIDAPTGVLTQVPCVGGAGCNGNRFMAGDGPQSVSVDPAGKFAYVANSISNDVSAYTLHATTGALTQIPCGVGPGCNGANFIAGSGATSVTVAPSGMFAYVANLGSDNVSAYTINAITGALTSIGPAVATGSQPFSVTTTGTIQ